MNESRSAAWTLTQLLRAIVVNSRRPWPLIVRTSGPSSIVARGSPGRVKMSGRAASMNGRAKNADRARRSGPSRARVERPTSASQAIPRAANDPIGSRLIATMKATVRMNFRRASARWTGCRGRRSDRGPGSGRALSAVGAQEPPEQEHEQEDDGDADEAGDDRRRRCRRGPGSCSRGGSGSRGPCRPPRTPARSATDSRPSGIAPRRSGASATITPAIARPTTHQ